MVIVAPVDRSDRAQDVVSQAKTLGEAFEDPVHVVHVLTSSEFVNLGRTSAEAGDPVDMDRVREVAAEIAREAVTDSDVPVEVGGLVGDPAARVVEYARQQDARYVVVAGRKRSPTGKALFGSVAQSILLNSHCPVVSVIRQRDA